MKRWLCGSYWSGPKDEWNGGPVVIQHKDYKPKWHRYYTIIPRKIGKRWYCCCYVYRKYMKNPWRSYWIYGNEFDVLRENDGS